MTVTLDGNGTLLITAETGVEAYALAAWERNRLSGRGKSKIVMDLESEVLIWPAIMEASQYFKKFPERLKEFKKFEIDEKNMQGERNGLE